MLDMDPKMKKAARIEAMRDLKSAIREPAIKWLKRIQQELAPKELYAFAKEWGFSQAPIEDPIGWTDDHFNRTYLQPLLEALPTSDLLLVAHIPVGILYTHEPDPNSYAIRPIDFDCCPVIAIDWTLFLFVNSVVPLALDCVVTPKGKREDILKRIRNCILDITSDGRLGRINKTEHDEVVQLMSLGIMTGVFGFVVAHEYGHIILGHLDPKHVTVKRGGFAKHNKNWEQEFTADLAGLRFAMFLLDALDREFPGINRDPFLRACPLIALTLIGCLENNLGIPPESSTHPPAALRMLRLELAIDPPLSNSAWECVQLFDWVLGYDFQEELTKYAQLNKKANDFQE